MQALWERNVHISLLTELKRRAQMVAINIASLTGLGFAAAYASSKRESRLIAGLIAVADHRPAASFLGAAQAGFGLRNRHRHCVSITTKVDQQERNRGEGLAVNRVPD